MKTREEFEINPVFSSDYYGERYTYGFRNRPFSIGTCPKGSILETYNQDDKSYGSRHGTIQYPFELTKDEIESYELIDFKAIYNRIEEFSDVLSKTVDELDKKQFKFIDDNSCRRSFDNGNTIDFTIYIDNNYPTQSFYTGFRTDKDKEYNLIESKSIIELKDTVNRVLSHIDKEIDKNANYKHEGTYLPLKDILNHAYTIRDTFNENIEKDTKPLDQAIQIINLVDKHNLRDEYIPSIKLSPEAAFGGNPLRHNEKDRLAVIGQLEQIIRNKANNQPAQSGKSNGGTTMQATTDTVQVKTETTLTSARIIKKLEYNAQSFEKKIKHFQDELKRIGKEGDKTILKTNKITGEVKEVPRFKELETIATREARNNLSKGEYISNIRIIMPLVHKKETVGITNEEEAKLSKATHRNAIIEKSCKHPANKKRMEKEFHKQFFLNCTTRGLSEQLSAAKTDLENANHLIGKIKELPPETVFTFKKIEQRRLSDLKYDLNFGRQLDAALTAMNTPAPEKKPASRKR